LDSFKSDLALRAKPIAKVRGGLSDERLDDGGTPDDHAVFDLDGACDSGRRDVPPAHVSQRIRSITRMTPAMYQSSAVMFMAS
jgi:hypothetical protein